jgi:hypothetical protein
MISPPRRLQSLVSLKIVRLTSWIGDETVVEGILANQAPKGNYPTKPWVKTARYHQRHAQYEQGMNFHR